MTSPAYAVAINGPRWSRTMPNSAGRTEHEEKPAPGPRVFTKLDTYDDASRLCKTTEPGVAPTLVS